MIILLTFVFSTLYTKKIVINHVQNTVMSEQIKSLVIGITIILIGTEVG